MDESVLLSRLWFPDLGAGGVKKDEGRFLLASGTWVVSLVCSTLKSSIMAESESPRMCTMGSARLDAPVCDILVARNAAQKKKNTRQHFPHTLFCPFLSSTQQESIPNSLLKTIENPEVFLGTCSLEAGHSFSRYYVYSPYFGTRYSQQVRGVSPLATNSTAIMCLLSRDGRDN